MNCINSNNISTGNLDRLTPKDITDKGSLNNYLEDLSTTSLSSRDIAIVNTNVLPGKDWFIAICVQNSIKKNNLFKDKLINCDYKEYKKWLLTRIKVVPELYEAFPINYAFSCGNFDLARNITSIMEIKYSLKHNKKMPPLKWLIKKIHKLNGKQYLEIFMTVVKLYLQQNTDIIFFKSLLLGNPVALHLLIVYASEQNYVYGLKQLLEIATIKNSLLAKIQQYLPSPLKQTLNHKNVAALECLLKYNYNIHDYITSVIATNNYFLFSKVINYINLNAIIASNIYSEENMSVQPLIYSFKKKCYEVGLTAICFGANINTDATADNLQLYNEVKPLFWAIYHKNINMLDILLALGAKRYKLSEILDVLSKNEATEDFDIDIKTLAKISCTLQNPCSLSRLASVSIAKNLIIKMQGNTNYKLTDMQQHIANYSTYFARKINSIEDLFSLTLT